MMEYRIAVLPGDGIGPEVAICAMEVLEAAVNASGRDVRFDFRECLIGRAAYDATGEPLPEATICAAREADGVLHGASDAAAIPAGIPSPLGTLRRALETYALVRPSVSLPGVSVLQANVDVVIVRESTEGLGRKIEYMMDDDTACAVRVVTRAGTERVARRAMQLAADRRGIVTATHKNLKLSDGLWLETIEGVSGEFPDVRLEKRNVDAVAMELVRHPQSFDVVLCENQNGDILSDVAAGVVGGLGLAVSAAIGDNYAYFEPVHGTAPDIAGQQVANPMAMVLAAASMLDHMGESGLAARVRGAVHGVLAEAQVRTPDLGGRASTSQVSRAIVDHLSVR